MTSFLLFSFSKLMENTAGFFTQKKFSKGLKLVVKNFNWTLSCTIQREIMLVISDRSNSALCPILKLLEHGYLTLNNM